MTVEELLETPLMQGAKLIAGSAGLMNEVTWCAADTDLSPDSQLIPRLFLIITETSDEEELLHRYIDRLGTIMVAGIGYFVSDAEGDFSKEAVEKGISHFNTLKIPVIKLPRGTNLSSFKKRFTTLFSKYYLEQKRRSEWLRELCGGSGHSGGEIMARTLGYNPDTGYYGMLLIPRGSSSWDLIQRELEVETVKNLLKSRLSKDGSRVLYFMGTDFVYAFFPWDEADSQLLLKRRIKDLADEIRESFPNHRWRLIVGSYARRLADFRTGYLRTAKLFDVIERLKVKDKAVFYEDWYMHLLLFNEPPKELQKHVSHVLAPIIDSPELIETLSSYLVYGENIRKTAQKTGVPESTFKYRLHRVAKLLDVDLDDPQTRYQLRMALTIERYLRG